MITKQDIIDNIKIEEFSDEYKFNFKEIISVHIKKQYLSNSKSILWIKGNLPSQAVNAIYEEYTLNFAHYQRELRRKKLERILNEDNNDGRV